MSDVLVIGTQGISHRDDMVLRALVRLLDGGINIRARFSEQLEECNVVFVPGNWPYRFPAPCITVGVKDPAKPDQSPDSACDLAVSTPLRMTNVIAVLQSATQRMHNVSQFDPVKGLRALFELLCERNRTAERSRAVVPMGSGQQIVVDFVKQLVHTAMPMDVLLSGAYTLGTPHRVSPVEEELIRSVPAYSLRHLVWQLALRLAQAGAVAPSRAGSYRLLRWPDAVGLAAPGHPRLAALWTNRALSLEQIDPRHQRRAGCVCRLVPGGLFGPGAGGGRIRWRGQRACTRRQLWLRRQQRHWCRGGCQTATPGCCRPAGLAQSPARTAQTMVMPSGAAPSGPTRDLKVVFTGPMGAGKTTAIRAISDSAALSTDVPISGTEAMAGKTMTTVGLDYGECSIDGQWVFKLFGTPGQDRFRFMWDILGAGAFGLIVLVDNSRPDPIGDVEFYLEAFEHHIPARRTVVGVGRTDTHAAPGIDEYCRRLAEKGLHPPVLEVDVRRDADVRLLLSVLVSMAEVEHHE